MRELLLINLEGLRYGIWEDEILSADEFHSIRHLPMSPAYLAGVSIVHDRTVTLADLSACVGHAPMKRGTTGHILLISDTEKFAGFVVEGEISKVAIDPAFEHPVPDYLRTPVIESCVVINSVPIPVINISALYRQMQKPDYEQPPTPIFAPDDRRDIAGIETIKVIELNNERFGVFGGRMEEQAMPVGRITRLAQANPFVRGVALHQGRILTIIDLYQRLTQRKTDNVSNMLVAEIRDALFGFLINVDKGTLRKDEFIAKDLPPIAQSDLVYAFIKYAGEILLLLDLGEILSVEGKDKHEKPLSNRYAPGSSFLDHYRKEDIEVLEFSLLGAFHALPKSEVKDIIPCKTYRKIPNAPDIVIGVTEHNEEALPVLDLAMVFGRRSLATPEWRMIHVVNGDFQALVLTEIVFGERRLPQEIQRAVPILLPHHVVYGCYPAADTVRLILNVAALAMHFEKSLVRDLLPALSTEMKQARAELVPSLLEESAIPSGIASESETLKAQPIPQEPATGIQPIKVEEAIPVMEPQVATEAIKAEHLPGESERVQQEEKHARQEAEEQARKEAETKTLQEAVEQQKAEAAKRAAEEERVRREAEEQTRKAAEAKALREAEERQRAEAAARAAEEERVRRETEEARAAEEKARQEAVERMLREAEERARREGEEQAAVEALRKNEAAKKAREEAAALVSEAEDIARRERVKELREATVLSTSFKSEEAEVAHAKTLTKPSIRWKSVASLIIIGVVIVAVLYSFFKKPTVEVKETKTPVETVQKKTKGPLVLAVPNGMSVGAEAYSIKKGDTLWGISKRFTGDPFNYPTIAGENNIADPDLIYPEQKVLIKKKE